MVKLLFFSCFLQFSALARWPVNAPPWPMHALDSQPPKITTAFRITTDIHLDGILDDSAWALAPLIHHFIQAEPVPGAPARFDTEVRLLYNDKYLYIGVICRDSTRGRVYRSPDMKRDFDEATHDLFGVAIDGFNDRRNGMLFYITPYGAQRDLLSFDDKLIDQDWDGLWQVRTQRRDSNWTAEMAIPWKTLRYRVGPDGEAVFGINFFRRRRSNNELSAWSPFPWSARPTRMDYAGRLEHIRPPALQQNGYLQPYMLLTRQANRGTETDNSQSTRLKAGGEVKWLLTPNNILDLTANTDFAQADAEVQVNNLSRFSYYYPEKRSFFLENAGLFGTGLVQQPLLTNSQNIIPFYSRRIGIDSNGNPIPLAAGARFVHRSMKSNTGVLVVQQRGVDGPGPGGGSGSGGSNGGQGGIDGRGADIPGKTFLVARHTQNLGSGGRIGGILTYEGEVPGGQLVSDLTYGIDGLLRAGKNFSVMGMTAGTHRSGRGQPGLPAEPGDGFAAFTQSVYRSDKWTVHWTESFVSRNFKPAAGFVAQNNVIGTVLEAWPEIQGSWLPRFSRYFEPGFAMEMFHNAATGALQQLTLQLYPLYFNCQDGGYIGVFITPNYQLLDSGFAPLCSPIPPGKYQYTRYSLNYGSDPSGKLSVLASVETGPYYNGRMNLFKATLNYAPIPNIFVSTALEWDAARGVGTAGSTPGGDPSGRGFKSAANADVQLWTLQARLALNPRLQLYALYQHNSLYPSELCNVRLSWEYKPLSYIYLVYNRNSYPGQLTPARQLEQGWLWKVSYLKAL